MMRLRGAIHFALACALVAPSAAAAQEAARPDPDSPSGVEYQLPLDRAREKAADPGDPGGPGRDDPKRGGGKSDPPPLFGKGISPEGGGVAGDGDSGSADDGSSSAGGTGDGGSGGDFDSVTGDRADSGDDSSDADPPAAEADAPVDDNQPSLATTSAEAGSGSSDLVIPAIALGVLLIGGLLGLALRHGLGHDGQA